MGHISVNKQLQTYVKLLLGPSCTKTILDYFNSSFVNDVNIANNNHIFYIAPDLSYVRHTQCCRSGAMPIHLLQDLVIAQVNDALVPHRNWPDLPESFKGRIRKGFGDRYPGVFSLLYIYGKIKEGDTTLAKLLCELVYTTKKITSLGNIIFIYRDPLQPTRVAHFRYSPITKRIEYIAFPEFLT